MGLVIGLDIGTQGAKAVLIDTADGKIVTSSSNNHDVIIPQAMYAEQHGNVWFNSTIEVLEKLLASVSIDTQDIKAIGISGLYGGSGIPVDKNITPLSPCLIWMDRRAEKETDWVRNNIDTDDLFHTTGNSVNSYFGFTKMMWIRDNLSDVWNQTQYFLPPSNYVIYKLTGELAIDYSSAGNIGGVYDIHKATWSDVLIEKLGLERSMFPDRLVDGTEIVGTLLPEFADKFGLSKETIVVSGGVDAPVSLFATGLLEQSQHVAMMGTSTCWGFLTTKDTLVSPDLVSMPFVINGKNTLYTFGGTSTSGALVTWFIENFFETKSDTVFDMLASYIDATKPGAEGLLVHPYFAGERSPIWDAFSSGTFFGLGLHHSKKHMYRAILESTAFSLRHNMDLVQNKVDLSEELTVVGGTSKSKAWLQIIADITGYPISIITEDVEAPLGSGILAAIACGLIKDEYEASSWMTLEKVCAPNQNNKAVYDSIYKIYVDVYEQTKHAMKALKLL